MTEAAPAVHGCGLAAVRAARAFHPSGRFPSRGVSPVRGISPARVFPPVGRSPSAETHDAVINGILVSPQQYQTSVDHGIVTHLTV